MIRQVLALSLAAAAALASMQPVAYAFKIDFKKAKVLGAPIHEEITSEALRSITLLFPDGTRGTVRESFIRYVAEENTENDEHGIDDGMLHFDDSQLVDSARHSHFAVQNAIAAYVRGDYDRLGTESGVQGNLGSAMHTTQDFFAHSTWVETNQELLAFDSLSELDDRVQRVVPIPKIGILEYPFNERGFLQSDGITLLDDKKFNDDGTPHTHGDEVRGSCSATRYDASSLQISSAYYDYKMSDIPFTLMEEHDNGWWTNGWNGVCIADRADDRFESGCIYSDRRILWPEGRCVHGDKLAGINKDTSDRTGHLPAYRAAVRATRALMLHFLNASGALTAANREKSCGFMLTCSSGTLPTIARPEASGSEANRPAWDNRRYFAFSAGAPANHLLEVEFEGQACQLLNEHLTANSSSEKLFACDTNHIGPGHLRIVQMANKQLALFEDAAFVVNPQPGIVNDAGDTWFKLTPVTAWIENAGSNVQTAAWRLTRMGAAFGEAAATYVQTWVQGQLNRISLVVNETGLWTLAVELKDAAGALLYRAPDKVVSVADGFVTPIVTTVQAASPIVAGNTVEFVVSGNHLPSGLGFNLGVCDEVSEITAGSDPQSRRFSCRVSASAKPGQATGGLSLGGIDLGQGQVASFAVVVAQANTCAPPDAVVDGRCEAPVLSGPVTETVRTVATSFEFSGQRLPTSGIAVSVPGDPLASCQPPHNLSPTGFGVACELFRLGAQVLEVRLGDRLLGTTTVNVRSNVSGVTWTSPSTTNSGPVRLGETVTFTVIGSNLTADTSMALAVEPCGASSAALAAAAPNQRQFACLFNPEAGAVAGLMTGVVKDAPGGQVLLDGWSVPVEVPPAEDVASLRWPDTGATDTQCLAAGSDVAVACNSAAARALNSQQDGMIRPGSAGLSYAEVPRGGGGNYARTECVKDQITGLVWEGKTADGSARSGTATFFRPNGSDGEAAGYASDINRQGLCGFTDWRLPTITELRTLVNHGIAQGAPLIDEVWFPNTQIGNSAFYQSSTPGRSHGAGSTMVQSFGSGFTLFHIGGGPLNVRLVRGSLPALPARFTAHNGGSEVRDALTGLVWRRCVEGLVWADGACTGTPHSLNHEAALAHARGQAGWRLPNAKELASLGDFSFYNPSIDGAMFPGTPSGSSPHWTSTLVAGTAMVYAVLFEEAGVYRLPRSQEASVRLVRTDGEATTHTTKVHTTPAEPTALQSVQLWLSGLWGDVKSVVWQFADGALQVAARILGTDATEAVTRSFEQAGPQQVTVTMMDDAGGNGSGIGRGSLVIDIAPATLARPVIAIAQLGDAAATVSGTATPGVGVRITWPDNSTSSVVATAGTGAFSFTRTADGLTVSDRVNVIAYSAAGFSPATVGVLANATPEVIRIQDTFIWWGAYGSGRGESRNFNDESRLVVCGTAWPNSGNGTAKTLAKFDQRLVPTSATSVFLNLYNDSSDNNYDATVEVYKANAAWTETDVTWNTQPAFSAATYGLLPMPKNTGPGWIKIPITTLVKEWQQGLAENHGLVLDARVNPFSGCRSFTGTNATSNRPYVSYDTSSGAVGLGAWEGWNGTAFTSSEVVAKDGYITPRLVNGTNVRTRLSSPVDGDNFRVEYRMKNDPALGGGSSGFDFSVYITNAFTTGQFESSGQERITRSVGFYNRTNGWSDILILNSSTDSSFLPIGTTDTTLWRTYAMEVSGGVASYFVDGIKKYTQSYSGTLGPLDSMYFGGNKTFQLDPASVKIVSPISTNAAASLGTGANFSATASHD